MKLPRMGVTALLGFLLVGGGTALFLGRLPLVASAEPNGVTFRPPPDSAIPNDAFGKSIKLGENIFRDPAAFASEFVGNDLRCSNCHLGAGREADAAPMWAAYVAYPAYRSKNKHVNSFEQRLQGCFRFSMNGKAPPLGNPVLVALESYAYFLAKGAPTGAEMAGRGYPRLPKLAGDYQHGAQVYAQQCAMCHGSTGQGQSSAGKVTFPPLWGPRSYNWGAGMASIKNAAAFIHANMPLGLGNTLTPQQAWDVATYIDSQVRPQDPHYALYVLCREKAGREASPTTAVIDSQSAKSAEKGGLYRSVGV